MADRAGRPVGRPAVDQSRTADAGKRWRNSRPRRTAPPSRARWRRCSERIAEAREEKRRVLAGRPIDADDRRRGRDHGRGRAADQRHALRHLQAQARLLFGLQPDPGFERDPAVEAAAAAAREPALPGRLAAALLRLRRRGDRGRRRGRHARSRHRSEARLGAEEPPSVSRSTSTRAEREMLLRVPGLGARAVDKIIVGAAAHDLAPRRCGDASPPGSNGPALSWSLPIIVPAPRSMRRICASGSSRSSAAAEPVRMNACAASS